MQSLSKEDVDQLGDILGLENDPEVSLHEKITKIVNGEEHSKYFISIKLIRATLNSCTEDSNPIVKFQIGNLEGASGPSLEGGAEPLWYNDVITLPLDFDIFKNKSKCSLRIVVVDKNPHTGLEHQVATYNNNGQRDREEELIKWIVNNRYIQST